MRKVVRSRAVLLLYTFMRSCDYCGREALGEESDCRECGKALAKTSSTPTSADSPPDLQWIPLEGESSEQSHQLKSMRLVGWALILGSLAVLGGSYLFAASTPIEMAMGSNPYS